MRTLILLLLAATASAQFTVTFTPQPLAATELVFANGRTVGVWNVYLCSEATTMKSFQRERVLAAAPQIPIMLNEMAQDILERKSKSSKWAIAGRIGNTLLEYAPAAVALWGASTGNVDMSRGGAIGAIGIGLLRRGVTRAESRAPDPSPYFDMMLPGAVTLAPDECHTYLVVSGLMRDAGPIGPIRVGVPEPPKIQGSLEDIYRERLAKIVRANQIYLASIGERAQ